MNRALFKSPVKLEQLEQQFATSGVYAIYCEKTDTTYIGQAQVVIKRIMDHFSEMKLNRHQNYGLQSDYNHYGSDSFSIDLLHDMPDSTDKERQDMETREIQRFRIYHQRLHNQTMVQGPIRTVEYVEPDYGIYELRPVKKSYSQKTTTKEHPMVTPENVSAPIQPQRKMKDTSSLTISRCYDCGLEGYLYKHVYECNDKKVRCSKCIEIALDNWTIEIKEPSYRNVDKIARGACFRWQIEKRKHIKTELINAIQRYIEKHSQTPKELYVGEDYNGPNAIDGIDIRIRGVTPKGHIDIPIGIIN